jgi:hypothetical protein
VSATVRRSRSSVGGLRLTGVFAGARLAAGAFVTAAVLAWAAFLATGFRAGAAFLAFFAPLFRAVPRLAAPRAGVPLARELFRVRFRAFADWVRAAFLVLRFARRGRAGARFALLLAIVSPL